MGPEVNNKDLAIYYVLTYTVFRYLLVPDDVYFISS